jgi:hypothetical protein
MPAEDDGVLDASDSLETDDLAYDPLDSGIVPGGGYRTSALFGLTAAEAGQGESLDQLLAEEEPDAETSSVDDRWKNGPEPRSGRLEADADSLAGFDRGIDGGAASAEEAAVHIVDLDQDSSAELDDATPTEPLEEAIDYTDLDARREAQRSDRNH